MLNNTGNTTALLTSFNALDASQQKVLLSSKLLNEQQKLQCMTMATLSSANIKYTAEELAKVSGISAETMANWGLTQSTDTLTMSQLAELASSDAQAKKVLEKIIAQNAQKVANGEITASNISLAASEGTTTLATGAFTTAIKANIAAMAKWLVTNPIGWCILATGSIIGVVKAVDALVVTDEELNQKIEETESKWQELSNTVKESAKSFQDLKSQADDIIPKYAKLAQGVDEFGNNVSLTDEEFKEFVSLNNQLGQMFPELVTGYDSNGNAILALSGNVDTLTESLYACVEAQRLASAKTIAETMPEVLEGDNGILKGVELYEEKIKNINSTIQKLKNGEFLAWTQGTEYSGFADAEAEQEYYDFLDLLKQKGIEVKSEVENIVGTSGMNYTATWDVDSNAVKNAIAGYEKQIDDFQKRIEAKWKQLNPVISAWLSTDFLYQDMDAEGQNIVSKLIGELDFKSLGLKTAEDVQNYISNNIISPIYDMDSDAQKAFFEIFDIQNALKNGSLSIEDYKKKIDGILSKGNFSEDFKNFFKLAFDFEDPSKLIEETTKNTDKMTVSLSEMEKASDKISKLGSAFKEFSDDGYITTKTLGELQTATGLSGDEWAEYENKLLNAKKGSADFNQVLSELTYKILENEFATIDLTNATDEEITEIENKIAATLRENGVENANAVAHEYVRMARVNAAIAAYDGTQASYDSAAALISESLSAEQAKVAMNQLELAKINANNAKITSSDDIDNIIAIANAALASEQTLKDLALAKAQLADDFVGPVSKSTMDIMNGTYEFEFDKLDPSDFKVGVPRYTGGSSKSGSDKNTPDYEDPTDAIINRINLRADELEQQEEEIQNLIEIAELENDYKKQISLTNDKLDVQRQKVDALKTANDELHQMAEDLRNSTPDWNEEEWFDSQGQATKAYVDFINDRIDTGASKEEIEAIKDQFEKISKIKEAWIKNDEERLGLTKEILQDEKEILDLRTEQFDKANDFANTYLESQKTLLQSHYDITNSITEARHELNKELETSMTMYAYLDEETRKLLFNQEDYNKLTQELNTIEDESLRLQSEYENKLRNATLETVESITSEYQMQYETLMKSYKIAKADLDIAKKKQQLNNVLNERNVKMLIDGKWQWVANADDVAKAKSELADAEYAKRVEEAGLTQQQSIDNLTRQQDALGVVVKQFENGVIDLDSAVRFATQAIDSMPSALASMYSDVKTSSTSSSSSGGSGGRYIPSPQGITYSHDQIASMSTSERSAAWYGASEESKYYLHKANEVDLGGTHSYDDTTGKWKKHADGTRYTPGGMTLMGEEGFEAFVDKNGHLIPIAQPTIGNIDSGGIVFNTEQMSNLRNLWDLSNIGKVNVDTSLINRTIPSGNGGTQNTFTGGIIINAPRDYNDFVRQLTQRIKTKSI